MAAIRTQSGMMMTNKYSLFPDSPHRHKSRSAGGPTSAGDSEGRQWTWGTSILSLAFWDMPFTAECSVTLVWQKGMNIFYIYRNVCRYLHSVRRWWKYYGVQAVPVTRQEGDKLARRLGALAYIETSALTGAGVQEAFEAAARALELRRPGCCGIVWINIFR